MSSVIMPSGAAGLSSTMARLMSIRRRHTAYSKVFYSLLLEGISSTFSHCYQAEFLLLFYLWLFFFICFPLFPSFSFRRTLSALFTADESNSFSEVFSLCLFSVLNKPSLYLLQGVHIQPEGLQLFLQWSWGGVVQP